MSAGILNPDPMGAESHLRPKGHLARDVRFFLRLHLSSMFLPSRCLLVFSAARHRCQLRMDLVANDSYRPLTAARIASFDSSTNFLWSERERGYPSLANISRGRENARMSYQT